MGLVDFLLGGDNSSSNSGQEYDHSVFDTDRFRNNRYAVTAKLPGQKPCSCLPQD